ncbi:MAG: lysine--tRNA ligase ['Conium maculatum' witches'-broom phytoplasma]|nr:lysine--tRNA ligase ['Conium maculatum' witches'-broom phytoplasma]
MNHEEKKLELEQTVIRKNKIEELKKIDVEPFKNHFFVQNNVSDLWKKYKYLDRTELENNLINVAVAGRIVLKRLQGKAGFFQLKDFDSSMQVYVNMKLLSPLSFTIYKNADLGDIVGIEGYLFKTKTDELTIKATNLVHLSKSLKALPDKHKGLKDKELIRKKRYIDLITNPKSMDTFVTRSKVIKAVRKFFDERDFLEVETPILHSFIGGASAKPFITHHNALSSDFYLRIATEIPLKKLIVGGMKAVYEIGRIFRNEGVDATHNPEFTTIEAYLAFSNMQGMMDLTESCLKEVAQTVLGQLKFLYQGGEIDFGTFHKYNMIDIIKEKTGVDFYQEMTLEETQKIAHQHKVPLEPFFQKGHIIAAFFEEFVEPTLIQPTFIYHYPFEVSPLAQNNKQDPRFTDRFELFIAGKEIVNAFSELNDPIEQKKRFEQQLMQKDLGDDEAGEMDVDFIEALEYGLPPTGGMGMGIDRLVMLLTDTPNIRDVILFPHFKHNNQIL